MVMFGGGCNGGTTNCRRVIDLDLQRLEKRRDRTQALSLPELELDFGHHSRASETLA
jgi:hypothetical protein